MSIPENDNKLIEEIRNINIPKLKTNLFYKSLTFLKVINFIILYLSLSLIFFFTKLESFANNNISTIGLFVYFFIILALLSVFLKIFWNSYFNSVRHLFLLSFITVFISLSNNIAFSISSFFSLIPAFSIITRIFTNFQISLVLSIVFTISNYIIVSNNVFVLCINIFSSIISIFSLYKIQQRADLTKAGFIVGIFNIIMIPIFSILLNKDINLSDIGWGFGTGIISSILAIGSLPYLENIFGLVTSFKLFELSNPNNHLLKELMIKAPGTYQHSLIVGNLAEAATEAVGGDPLLARVGALYHDIGKMIRPHFFIENQLNMENQHSKISPRLSSAVITAHVKEGIEMAKAHKLPDVIIDFIPMHHGTSLVSYFYHQAKQTEKPEDVLEEHFRYPGPKPRTKETAILMLADATEAAVRSVSNPSIEQIQKIISKIIKSRIDDGQLSEAPLTLVDLDKISTEFLRILQSLYHKRIEYPSEDKIMKDLSKK
jgi:hypothetical protein